MLGFLTWSGLKPGVKILRLPFARSAPLYEKPPAVLSNTVPTEMFTQVHVENIQHRAKDREAGMKLYWADQERADLARKLKEAQGELLMQPVLRRGLVLKWKKS